MALRVFWGMARLPLLLSQPFAQLNQQPIRWVLLLCLGQMLLYWAFGFDGYSGYDDIGYARIAAQLAQGDTSSMRHSFGFRWGIVLPLSLLYRTLGVNDFATSLLPLLYTLGSLCLVYRISKHWGFGSSAMAMILFSLDYYTLFYAVRPYPDPAVTFFLLLTFYGIYLMRTAKKPNQVITYVSFGVLGGLMTKLSFVFAFPCLFLFFLKDIFRKHNQSVWFSIALILIGTLLGYLIFCQIAFGDFLVRFSAVNANQYVNYYSYHLLPAERLYDRVGFGLLHALIGQGLIMAMLFVPVTGYAWISGKLDQQSAFWLAAFTGVFVVFYWGSTSLEHYIPLNPEGRQYLPLIPLGALASSRVISSFLIDQKFQTPVLIFMAMFGMVLLKQAYGLISYLYFLMIIIFISRYFIFKMSDHIILLKNKKLSTYFIFIFGLILWIHPVYVLWKPKVSGHWEQRMIIQDIISDHSRACIIGDHQLSAMGDYYLGFATASIAFKDYALSPDELREDIPTFLLLNAHTNLELERYYNVAIPVWVKSPAAHGFALVRQENGVSLFVWQPDR